MTNILNTFHDSELNEIKHDRTLSKVFLSFTNEDGSIAKIIFEGVCGLRLIDYGMQNVVSRLLTSQQANEREEINFNVTWINETSEGKCLIDKYAVENLVDKIEKGELLLFILEPSWGAEMRLLARAFSVT